MQMTRLGRPVPALLLLLAAGCGDEILDTTRKTNPRGTLGEEVFKLFHKDLLREDTRRAQGFLLEHDEFVAAIDHIFPPNELAYTERFLEKLLPLYDDGSIPEATVMLAGVAERLTADPEALVSLAAIEHRIGYVDRAHEEALVRRVAHYSEYRKLMRGLLQLYLDHDGLDANGNPSPQKSDAIARLCEHVARRLETIAISEDTERDIVLLTDFLMKEDPRLSATAPAPAKPAVIVARDSRGMAKVRLEGGRLLPPFSPSPQQGGLPAVDVMGRFLSTSGGPVDLPPFSDGPMRDPKGRPLTSNGSLVYEYVDLNQTLLAGLARDGRDLVREGLPMKAVRTLDLVLGARQSDGRYGKEDSGLLDLVHAIGTTVDLPELPEVLELLRMLLEQHEPTTAWMALEMESQLDISDNYDVRLRQGSSFFDDLMSTLRKILREPGLAEDILVALRDPAMGELPAVQQKLLGFRKDRITQADVMANRVFTQPVDRRQPDTRQNQSLQQRILHLIKDTHGASYEPHLIGIPLGFIFKIDDLAEFYLLSEIGKSEVPALVARLTGLSQRPTPQELAAFINTNQTFGNAKGHEGIEVKENDGDTLFAATSSGMIRAMHPLIQVFHDHGKMALLFELLEVLHMHWASPEGRDYQDRSAAMPRYSRLSGIRNYEPMLIDTFQHARVLDAVRRLLEETKDLRTSRGNKAHDLLLKLARKMLNKDTDLKTRDDKREVFAGGERITPLSPFDLIRGARSKLRSVVQRSTTSQAEWNALVDAVNRKLLKMERTGPQTGRMKNSRALPLASALFKFLEDRAAKHARAGDLSKWIRQDFTKTVADAITAPELPAAFDLIYAIDREADLSSTLAGLRDELLDEDKGFQDFLAVTGDLLQTAKDASLAVGFLRFFGKEIAPSKKLVFALSSLTQKSIDLDPDQHMLEVMRRAIDDAPFGGFYAYGLSHTIRQANRFNPLDTSIVSADDIRKIATMVRKYATDDQHGLKKFYQLVHDRKDWP